MNPWGLDATGLMVWGLVAHLIADWPLQNDWMARNKANLQKPAGYVHAAIHGVLFASVFGWVAIPLAFAHLLIDIRKPVVWWLRLVQQTQPIKTVWIYRSGWEGHAATLRTTPKPGPLEDHDDVANMGNRESQAVLVDVGMEVRFWTDQVFHIICIAIAALAIT
jgi:hypothetical protein